MTEQPKAIFFDMDGTILDWQSGMEESWLASCEQHCAGGYVPAELHDAIRVRRTWFWGDPERANAGRMDLDASSREIVRRAFDDMRIKSVELAHRISDDYRALRDLAIAPYPGAIELLAGLQSRGTRMALITNGAAISQRRSVERFALARYFDCVVIEGEFGVGKPDERVFQHALASCGVEAADTWMVGDSLEADIAPAVRLGMHAVWIDGAGELAPTEALRDRNAHVRPHRVIKRIDELMAGERTS
ncbi:MAG: HAD family hydrolase [Dehalococcoidia bacterium]